MTFGPKADLTAQIMAEIIRAITRLGGDRKSLPESSSQDDLLALLRRNGADRYLIGTVASWKDTMDDEEVLDDLQRLNEGSPHFDHIIASRDDKDSVTVILFTAVAPNPLAHDLSRHGYQVHEARAVSDVYALSAPRCPRQNVHLP